MSRSKHRGFTLIEVIIFIVVVGAGLAGILSVSNTVIKSSADPVLHKQAIAIADSILEEILQKEFQDPDGVGGEATRATMDDVSDYNSKTETLFNSSSGAGGWLPALDAYSVAIVVATDTAVIGTALEPAKRVTVTVSRGTDAITVSGYRANY